MCLLALSAGCGEPPLACESDGDCGAGARCLHGRCEAALDAAMDAASPGSADAGAPRSDAGPADAAPVPDGGSGDAGSPSPDAGTDAGTDGCSAIDAHPLVTPEGFIEHRLTWEEAFYGNSYPSTGSPLAPMGSFTLREPPDNGPPIAGRYLTIPFTPSTGVYLLTWLPVQFIPEHDYIATPDMQTRPAATVYFTVSRCPGDFRLADSASGDPALHRGCRKMSNSGALFYSGTESGFNSCPVEVGEVHYLNVLFADPTDGLTTTENSCGAGRDACEVNTRHQRQSS